MATTMFDFYNELCLLILIYNRQQSVLLM